MVLIARVLAVGLVLSAMVYWAHAMKAWANRSEVGQRAQRMRFWGGPLPTFGPRAHYSERGWRSVRIAKTALLCVVVTGSLMVLTMSVTQ